MGYYIETDNHKNKAQWLVEKHRAVILDRAPLWDEIDDKAAAICVVDNGMFEAAALCYSKEELEAFQIPDTIESSTHITEMFGVEVVNITIGTGRERPRTWLLIDKKVAYDLAGYTQ